VPEAGALVGSLYYQGIKVSVTLSPGNNTWERLLPISELFMMSKENIKKSEQVFIEDQ